jgi:hypothetical protein
LQPLRFFLFLTALLLLLPLAASAKEGSLYAVHGIAVDITADNDAAAREKAIAEGARKGLEQLLKNLTLPEDAKSLPPITDKIAGPLVQDFEVESERTSSVRYIAALGFRSRPDGVRALLQNIHAVSTRAPGVLVIPVYRAAGGDLLWQPNNSWRLAWKEAAAQAGMVPVIVPEASAQDAQEFTAADLGDRDKLLALAARYKAGSAVVAVAVASSATGDPQAGMQVALTDGGGADDSFHAPGGATPAEALNHAVLSTLDELDALWKKQVLQGAPGAIAFKSPAGAQASDDIAGPTAATGPTNDFAVEVALAGPADWSNLRTKLTQLGGIARIDLKSLSRDRAVLVLATTGTEDQLRQVMKDGGLTLGPPVATAATDSDVGTYLPVSGPGAGMLYTVTPTGSTL